MRALASRKGMGATGRRAPALLAVVCASAALSACGSLTHSRTHGGTTGKPAVKAVSATVDSQSEQILTTANGRPLYYHRGCFGRHISCLHKYGRDWRPWLIKDTKGVLPPVPGAPGKVSVVQKGTGFQIEYDKYPLFLYREDQAEHNGGRLQPAGEGGPWLVATPNLGR